jgi:hypothetical protein
MTTRVIRSIFFAAALGACAGSATPTTMARLDSLPGEHVAREQRLESTSARPGPETTKGKSTRWRQAETVAATAAAVVGSLFSTTKTVTIGAAMSIDENELVDPSYGERGGGKAKKGTAEPETYDAGTLTPWVRLRRPEPE